MVINMYSQNDFRNYVQNDQLEHHGILGQKWGRRQGPPYPLDAGDHSAAEKKAGWRKSLDTSTTYGAQKQDSRKREDFKSILQRTNRENKKKIY